MCGGCMSEVTRDIRICNNIGLNFLQNTKKFRQRKKHSLKNKRIVAFYVAFKYLIRIENEEIDIKNLRLFAKKNTAK